MKKVLKVIGKIIGILILIALLIAILVYFLVLRYPEIKNNPKVGKWYRVTSKEMKSSEGGSYHALFKKGKENNVMVYFAGGGVSINEATAKNDTYNTRLVWPDMAANITMNMGGLATAQEKNPFSDWTFILFPYATGDFDCGAGEFKYTDKDGKEKILYHNGYINFTKAMDEILEKAGIENPDSVVVTGYSAGGWASSFLAEDVFTNYFPNAKNKVVLVDSGMALNNDWKNIAENVWHSPEHIVNRIKTDNVTYDNLVSLKEKLGDDVTILFDCSTRDGDLSKIQRFFLTGEIDEKTGEMPVTEEDADEFQKTLKEFVNNIQEDLGAYVYIFDEYDWYGDPRNFTSHTAVSVPQVFEKINGNDESIAEWLYDNVNGKHKSYGIDLLDKVYEKTKN